MEFQKRLDYAFNGFQVPVIPRSTRSKRRSAFGNRCKEENLQAFDLLATVAEELFHPAISWDDSTVKEEPEIVKKEWPKIEPLFETLHNEGHFTQITSRVMSSDSSERITGESTSQMERLACKIDIGSSHYMKSMIDCNLECRGGVTKEDELDSGAGMDIGINENARALESSNNGCKVPFCRDNSNPANHEDIKVVSRDDDENTSGCTHLIDPIKPSFRPSTFDKNRKVRKMLPSKYWKVNPRCREKGFSKEHFSKPLYRIKRNSYKYQRSQMNIPFKKRKFLDCNSVSDSDGTFNIDDYSNTLKKRVKTDAYGSGTSAFAGHRKLFQSRRDSHVKLKIRSFRVPEFFIEIPESATIGSLKRTVMEAVTTILGNGLRVGVLLQGKKIRDDNKTLFQTGISHDNQLDSLGFILEPTPQASSPPCHGSSPTHKLLCDSKTPVTRYPPAETMVNLGTVVESDRESAPSPVDAYIRKSPKDCKALVAVDALAVVQPHQKLKQSEVVQRRIRRPFSVAEVEALVETVEKLGTGRWRDVKVCAFDNAKHRTYVDLKDKWKTLVHTARIAPQQRRGEPVPQELLDRVLAAQSYWSQHQPKLLKHKPEPCLLI